MDLHKFQAVGGELSEQQVEKEFTTIRDHQRIEREATVGTIKRYYETHEVEVTKVSLMCPVVTAVYELCQNMLSKARVKIPVRAVNCRHIECMDLRSYLDFHTQLTFWECPFSFCHVQVRCESLRVDDYMSVVLQDTDDLVKEVEVFTDGSFHAVQPPTPAMQEIVDDENLCIPAISTAPIVKTEVNNENLGDPMESDAFRTDEDQPQAASLAESDEEQLRDARSESRQQVAALHRELTSEKNRADTAESDASKLRDENCRVCEDLATKVHEICELTDKNKELRTRLNALLTSAEVSVQINQEPTEYGSLPMDEDPHEPSSSLAAGDAANKEKQKRPFTCAERGRVFNDRSNRSRHQRTHSGEKPYQCAHCDKKFTEASKLRTHKRIHTSDKPYECAQCGKMFRQTGHLRAHERTHSGEKPYQCAYCNKAFTVVGNLRAHERIHTGDKPFECAHCDKNFVQAIQLRKHERTRHPVVVSSKATKNAA